MNVLAQLRSIKPMPLQASNLTERSLKKSHNGAILNISHLQIMAGEATNSWEGCNSANKSIIEP